jgi:flavin reductase (DIM6/NTAB) family NADH-FMN oxidoreductase RutF
VLADAAAWLDCTLHSSLPTGTHTLFVGEVRATHVPVLDRPPLVYWGRGYRPLGLDDGDSGKPPVAEERASGGLRVLGQGS